MKDARVLIPLDIGLWIGSVIEAREQSRSKLDIKN